MSRGCLRVRSENFRFKGIKWGLEGLCFCRLRFLHDGWVV